MKGNCWTAHWHSAEAVRRGSGAARLRCCVAAMRCGRVRHPHADGLAAGRQAG